MIYLHHIQPDNYIHIDTSFRLFPPPVTSKASFLNLSNNGTTYSMTVSASTHLNILTELFSQCLIKTYVAITYQVDIKTHDSESRGQEEAAVRDG